MGGAASNVPTSHNQAGGAGGPGVPNTITGSDVTYAAGGKGEPGAGPAGTANTGNGGGAQNTGGSGIVVLRFPSAADGSVSVAPGTNSVAAIGPGEVVATFTVSGTLTIG
jgi:hypothetical protein